MTARSPIIDGNDDEYRWRVIQVLTMNETAVFARRAPREFRTAAAAHRHAERIRNEGFPVAVQLGKVHWFSEDERDDEMNSLPASREPR